MQSEAESRMDEMERDNLQKEISQVETALSVSTSASRPIFETFLTNARNRVTALEKKIKDSQVERENHAREQVAIADLAQKEAAFSTREKETYSGFLRKDFFTKADFASLEKFYANTWDRLSDQGKDQMSHRFWEGVRRNEYQFHEAPSSVREKDTDWAYTTLAKRERSPIHMHDIPENDRGDFICAYEGGRRDEAERILERDGFKQNMFRAPASKNVGQTRAERGRDADQKALEKVIAANESNAEKRGATERKSATDISDLRSEGVTLAEAPVCISSSEIPNVKAQAGGKPSLG